MGKPIKWIAINNENDEMQFRASYAINHSDLMEDNDPYYPFGGGILSFRQLENGKCHIELYGRSEDFGPCDYIRMDWTTWKGPVNGPGRRKFDFKLLIDFLYLWLDLDEKAKPGNVEIIWKDYFDDSKTIDLSAIFNQQYAYYLSK